VLGCFGEAQVAARLGEILATKLGVRPAGKAA